MESKQIVEEISELKTQIRRQARLLRWSVGSWLVVTSVALLGVANPSGAPFFQEIKVGRLALVDSNGIERLILATENTKAHINGKDWDRGPQVSGIILQNEKGDEVGGVVTSNCIGQPNPCPATTAIMLDGYTKYRPSGGTERVGLFSREDGTAGFVLIDLKEKMRSLFATDPNLNVSMALNDGNENVRTSATVSADGKVSWIGQQVESKTDQSTEHE